MAATSVDRAPFWALLGRHPMAFAGRNEERCAVSGADTGVEAKMPKVAVEVPARRWGMVEVPGGQTVRVVDVQGGQVADFFAFALDDPTRFLSASHTRAATMRSFPALGQAFVTTRREELLCFEADDSPGVHDLLIAACDPYRYELLGSPGHRSCAANLLEAFAGRPPPPVIPQPVNFFMAVDVASDGSLTFKDSPSAAGDSVTLRALQNCLVVVSACPQDLVPVNRGGPSSLVLELGA
jgi:uncharacterized protein YcgI (DUF1989 family)